MIKRIIRRSYKNNSIEQKIIQERRMRRSYKNNIIEQPIIQDQIETPTTIRMCHNIEQSIIPDQNEKKINKFGFIMLRHVKDEN